MKELLAFVLSQLPKEVEFEVWDADEKVALVSPDKISVDEISGISLMDASGNVYGVCSEDSNSKVKPTAVFDTGVKFWLFQEPARASQLNGTGTFPDIDMDESVKSFDRHRVNYADLLSNGNYEIGFGTSSDTRPGKWKSVPVTKGQFIKQLSQHLEGDKDGHCFTQGSLLEGKRSSKSVVENYIMVFDIDIGLTETEIIDRLKEFGYEYVLYSTHSHLKETSMIKRDHFFKWSKEDPKKDVKVSSVRSYMTDVKKILPRVLENLEVVKDVVVSSNGTMTELKHAPIPKYRVVFFLNSPFVFQGKYAQNDRIVEWKERYYGLSKLLNLPVDKSCVDPGRLFYFPRHDKGREHSTIYSAGAPVTIDVIERISLRDLEKSETGPSNVFSDASSDMSGDDRDRAEYTFEGFDLIQWAGKFSSIFDIQEALDRAGYSSFRDERTAKDGIHIQCPYEDGHTEAGGNGTYVVNASDNIDSDSGFVIHCMHDSCSGRDRLMFLKGLLEEGSLTVDDLKDMNNMCEEIVEDSEEPEKEVRVKKYSREWFERKVGSMDEEATNHYRIIKDLAESEEIPEGVKNKLVSSISKNTGISKTKLSKYFEKCCRDVEAQEETKKTKKAGGIYSDPKVSEIVASMNESLFYTVSAGKVLRITSDIEGSTKYEAKSVYDMYHMYANMNETILVKGEEKEVNHFELWLRSPERNTVEGLTYQPRKPQRILNPAGGVWLNTYSEFTRWDEDNPGSSWDLMKAHIKEILCKGDDDIFNRFLLFFANIIQNPDKKYAQTLIIKGDIGCGKSIVMDYMREMLGKMCSMEVNDARSITGKFNQHLAEKLFVVLDEGDFKRSMNTMKNLISSKSLEIEPKGMPKIWVNNCIRFAVTTNEGDTIVVALDTERRFFVIECSNRWVQGAGASKVDKEEKARYFSAIAHQMDNGGVDQMFYDLKHFVPEDHGLSFATDLMVAPMTDALREESVSSTTPESEIFCEMVLNGGFDEAGPQQLEEVILYRDKPSSVPKKLIQSHVYHLLDKKKVGPQVKRTPFSVRNLLERLTKVEAVRDVYPDYANILESEKKDKNDCYTFPPVTEMAQHLADRGYISKESVNDV